MDKDDTHYITGINPGISGRAFTALLLLCLIFGYATYSCLVGLQDFYIPFLVIRYIELSWISLIFCLVFAAAGLMAVLLFLKRLPQGSRGKVAMALAPVAGLGVIAVIPPSFSMQIVFTAIVSISVFRLFALGPPVLSKGDIPRYASVSLLLSLTCFFVIHGYFIQHEAYMTLHLSYGDWAEYLEIARNTVRGEWFMMKNTDPHFFFLSTHFSPGSLFPLALFVMLFESVPAFFLMNSLVLYSAGPLSYILARSNKLPRASALCLAACVLLSPSLANLNLTNFNGFHPIILMNPAIFFFFIFLGRNWFFAAFAVFMLSLTFQETVPVFWVGMGAALICSGQRKTGASIVCFSLLYYVFIMHFVLPSIALNPEYDYAIRFEHLGASSFEIMVSPLSHPIVFFGHLLRPESVYFVLMLLVPMFILALRRPVILLGAGITVMFVCLQNSNQVQNICLQYQTEGMTVVFVAATLGAVSLYAGRDAGRFLSALMIGIPQKYRRCSRRILFAALPALLASALCSAFFFGDFYFLSRSMMINLIRSTRRYDAIDELKQLIPEGAQINASRQMASQFLIRNDVTWHFDRLRKYIILDLNEPFMEEDEKTRVLDRIRASGDYALVYAREEQRSHFLLFARK